MMGVGAWRETYMITVGETLRRERLKQKKDLDQISRELKISPRFLEAIEDEDFEKLPGGVFARAFVRQYGRLLGLNDDELASQLQQVLDPPPEAGAEPGRPAMVGLAPIQVPRMEEWQTIGDPRFHWTGPLSAAIVLVMVLLVCSGVYAWLQRPRNPVSAHSGVPQSTSNSPAQPPAQTSLANVHEAPPIAAGPAPVRQPLPAATSPNTAAAPQPNSPVAAAGVVPPSAPPNPNATVRVDITASEPVWVLARTDGKFAFTGTMEQGQTRSVDATRDVVLRLGNAGGVTIMLNGKPVPPIGPKGQPRTVQFTSGGFQIVPAAKPPSEPGAPASAVPIVRL